MSNLLLLLHAPPTGSYCTATTRGCLLLLLLGVLQSSMSTDRNVSREEGEHGGRRGIIIGMGWVVRTGSKRARFDASSSVKPQYPACCAFYKRCVYVGHDTYSPFFFSSMDGWTYIIAILLHHHVGRVGGLGGVLLEGPPVATLCVEFG